MSIPPERIRLERRLIRAMEYEERGLHWAAVRVLEGFLVHRQDHPDLCAIAVLCMIRCLRAEGRNSVAWHIARGMQGLLERHATESELEEVSLLTSDLDPSSLT